MTHTFTDIQEALIRLLGRATFGLVFGLGLALVWTTRPIWIVAGGAMMCMAFPECVGLGGLGEDLELVFEDDEDEVEAYSEGT